MLVIGSIVESYKLPIVQALTGHKPSGYRYHINEIERGLIGSWENLIV